MRVTILGAGVAGVTTAYMLSKQGCQVTLIDQYAQAGKGSSYGNGGQLSYNYRTPIANPSVLKQLPKILLGLDSAFKVYPSLDIRFYDWGLRFLWQCLAKNSQYSAQVMCRLGELSRKRFAEIIADTGIEFDYRKQAGKVYIYKNKEVLQENLSTEGSPIVWSRDKLFQKIPSLNAYQNIIGGLYDKEEDAADSYKFCGQLTRYLQKHYGLLFLGSHTIVSIEREGCY